jgi:hypothetical protein
VVWEERGREVPPLSRFGKKGVLAILKRTTLLAVIEALAFASSVVLGILWARAPSGPYEPFLVIAGLAFGATELFRRYEGKFFRTESKSFTPAELVQHREQLRKILEEEIYRCRREKLRKDVIIRHVNRVDSYPNVDENAKGISPWFRVGLLDTYHKGIKVGLRFGTLTQCAEGYRYTNYKAGEKGDMKICLIGEIPYEYIEAVNIDGDEYYSFPHIYCHYANKGEPYERLIFCEEIDMGHSHVYYKEVAAYEDVRRNSEGTGAEYFA